MYRVVYLPVHPIDLLTLEAQHSPEGDIADPHLAPINTLLHKEACLWLHSDQKFVQYFMRALPRVSGEDLTTDVSSKGQKRILLLNTLIIIDNYLQDKVKSWQIESTRTSPDSRHEPPQLM